MSRISDYVKDNYLNWALIPETDRHPVCDDIPVMSETENAVIVETDSCNEPTYIVFIFPKNSDSAYFICLDNHYSDEKIEEGKYDMFNCGKWEDGVLGINATNWDFWRDRSLVWTDEECEKHEDEDLFGEKYSVKFDELANELPEEFNTVEKILKAAEKFYGCNDYANFKGSMRELQDKWDKEKEIEDEGES